MKLVHPAGGGNFSHNQIEYVMNDGVVDVPDHVAVVAFEHGYVKAPADMPKPTLVAEPDKPKAVAPLRR